jgi:hypothetical protein
MDLAVGRRFAFEGDCRLNACFSWRNCRTKSIRTNHHRFFRVVSRQGSLGFDFENGKIKVWRVLWSLLWIGFQSEFFQWFWRTLFQIVCKNTFFSNKVWKSKRPIGRKMCRVVLYKPLDLRNLI